MAIDRVFQARITGVYDRPLDFGYQREAFLAAMSRYKRSTIVGVIIKEYRKIRTKKQNAYYWSTIVPMVAEHLGYTEKEAHETLKFEFLSSYDPKTCLRKIRSTTELTTLEFIEYNEWIKRWAAVFLGLVIPDPRQVFSWEDNPIFSES
jgi:hypothetical protein